MSTLRWIVALLALPLFAPAAIACPMSVPTDVILTPAGTSVYEDGGVILGVSFAWGSTPVALVASAEGADAIERTPVAGAITIARPPAGATAIQLHDRSGKLVRTIAVVKAPKPIPPPVVASVTSSLAANAPPPPPMGISGSTFMLELKDAAPADAYGLVIYRQTGRDIAPYDVLPVERDQKVFTFTTGGKACVAGARMPIVQGARLELAWLDRGGRISASSKPVTVAAAKPAANRQ